MAEDGDCTLTVHVENKFHGDVPELRVKPYDELITPGHAKSFQLKGNRDGMEIFFDCEEFCIRTATLWTKI